MGLGTRLLCVAVFCRCAALQSGCSGGRALTYGVSVLDNCDSIRVRMEIRGAPARGLRLNAFTPAEVIGLASVCASAPDGRLLAVRTGRRPSAVHGQKVDFPYVDIVGPLPGTVRVTYVVRTGRRQGNDHTGFTGISFGEIQKGFGFLVGRDLLLVPSGYERCNRIRVRNVLPPGWSWESVTTGSEGGWMNSSRWSTAEEIVASPVALGRFRQRVVRVGRTSYRFLFEQGIPESDLSRSLQVLERVVRYARDVFRRDPGMEYRVLVLPAASSGDDFDGSAWSTGQGSTLYPTTVGRVHRFAERLIDAYLVHPGHRSRIQDPAEYWVVDGIRGLYSWRAVAHAGLITEEDVDRGLGAAYLSAILSQGGTRDLEHAYDRGPPDKVARSILAPATALALDRALRENDSSRRSLDDLLPVIFRGRRAGSFWGAIGRAAGNRRAADLRDRFVRGKALLPVERLLRLKPTTPMPDPPARPPVRMITLAYTGDSYGFLENCGCKVNQSGGLARRATVLEQLRGYGDPVFLLDAGNTFREPEDGEELDYLAREEQRLYVRVMDRMRYDAVAVGVTELARNVRFFLEMTEGTRTPFLLANAARDGQPIAPPTRTIERGGLRIGIIGALEPPRGLESNRLFEDNTRDLAIDDPVLSVQRCSESLSRNCDLVVALGRLTAPTIRRIVDQCPDVDIVVSNASALPLLTGPDADATIQRDDRSGFLGRALVLYTLPRQYGLSFARIGLDASGNVASGEVTDRWLGAEVPDDAVVRGMLSRFYEGVGRRSASLSSVKPLFTWDAQRQTGTYVGAEQCAACHEQEHAQWRTTAHALAYRTLLEAHRHFQPRCVVCHVVGFGVRSGYRLGALGEALANVQCEVCHGPGAAHVASPSVGNIERAVPERICVECHTPDHSDHFVYSEELQRVQHGLKVN